MNKKYREESDSMGSLNIPDDAYWGAQTERAVQNFSVSSFRIPRLMIVALSLIKKNMAIVHKGLQIIDAPLCDAIAQAADEVLSGKWDSHFPIDVFQTGSGTSWNMNINEVIANRANQILGSPLGSKNPVHPNDHVNRGQSSNDVIPSALHIANRMAVAEFLPKLRTLHRAFDDKARECADIIKLGRTHLQDAVPMTVGQEFSGFAQQIKQVETRIGAVLPELEALALGGTAVGTGLNAHPQAPNLAIQRIAAETQLPFHGAPNRFAVMAARDAQVALMAAVNGLAVVLMKIANDIRLLASGPRSGFAEIILPALQPGSSIMPGKVNPVIPEMIVQVAAYLMGACAAVTVAGQHAPLQLNMMHPLIAFETLTALEIAGESCVAFAERCVVGITVDEKRCKELIEQSLALVTPLANEIGYDMAAQLAHQAYHERRTIREVVLDANVLPAETVDKLLDPQSMIRKD